MLELTQQQRQAVAQEESPVVIDPESRQAYVLVRKDLFDRMKTLLAPDEYNPDEGMAFMNEVMAEDDANDPLLDSYQPFRGTGT